MSESPLAPPPAPPAEEEPKKTGRRLGLVVVPFVLLVSILIGVLLAQSIQPPPIFFNRYPFYLSIERALELHIVLSTVEMALLASLVVVYVKVYASTRAYFSLGLIVVFVALLVNSITTYPLVVNQVGPVIIGSGNFFPYTDLLAIVAYSVFLFISLE